MVYHKHGDAVGYILSSIHVSSPVIIDSCPSPHLKVPKIFLYTLFFSYRVFCFVFFILPSDYFPVDKQKLKVLFLQDFVFVPT